MGRATVIGWPIEHSKSPLIHGHWLRELKISGTYDKTAVAPEDLADFVQRAWASGLAGFNATIPHKEALIDLVQPDETARAIGAINTVFRGPDGFIGTNTDGMGWWRSLDLKHRPARALVLGAGGAARAIVHTLASQGTQITLSNRTAARAQELAASLNIHADISPWSTPDIDARGFDLIVNTSACGMNGENPIRVTHLDPGALVSDLVYVPMETELLASARALGGHGVDGLGMLLHQAAGGFELWFGARPTVDAALRDAVLAA